MVTVGQTLYGINKETGMEETVKVISVNPDNFRVEYKGKKKHYQYSALNSIFHTEPRAKKNTRAEKKCDNCFYRYTGDCTSLSNVVCEDFRAKQTVDQDELENRPKYGDATAYRFGDREHFK